LEVGIEGLWVKVEHLGVEGFSLRERERERERERVELDDGTRNPTPEVISDCYDFSGFRFRV